MYKKILVPLDGSGRAEAILPHVEKIAQNFGSTVIFMEVVEPFTILGGPEAAYSDLAIKEKDRQQEEADTYLSGMMGEFREKGLNAQKRVAQGQVVDSIIDIAQEENVDLIALASHGKSGLARVFYGSVAAGLLQRVDRPLLLIRSRYKK